jgi:hypothetical protein
MSINELLYAQLACEEAACINTYQALQNKDVWHCVDCHCLEHKVEDGVRFFFCSECQETVCEDCVCEKSVYSKSDAFCKQCVQSAELKARPRPCYFPNATIEIENYGFVRVREPPAKRGCWQGGVQVTFLSESKEVVLNEQFTLYQVACNNLGKLPQATTLQQKHPHKWDKDIFLDESDGKHDYTIRFNHKDWETDFIQSTSGRVHDYFPGTFETYEAVAAMLNGKRWGPKHPKYGQFFTEDETKLVANLKIIIQLWETNRIEASVTGTFVHNMCELASNNQHNVEADTALMNFKRFQQAVVWRKKLKQTHDEWRTEMRFFSTDKHRACGSTDLIAVLKNHPPPEATNGKLHVSLYDYKNLAELKTKSFSGKAFGLTYCAHLQDCNLQAYTLQQNDYAKLSSRYHEFVYNGYIYTDLHFDEMQLIIFNDENPNNRAIEVMLENRQLVLKHIWRERALKVAAWEKQGRPKQLPPPPPIELTDDEQSQLLLNIIYTVKNNKKI